MTDEERQKRQPRDLNKEPLRPGEFPIEGDTDSSFLGNKHVIIEKPDNGKWGIMSWTWIKE